MATVEVFTKARMQAIEDDAIVDARIEVVGAERQLILIRNSGVEINAGNVRGEIGATPTVPDELNWNTTSARVAGASPVGGSGVPPLRIQTGTTLMTSDTQGREVFTMPVSFNGIASVIVQVGQNTDLIFSHIDGGSPGVYGVSVENLSLFTDSYTTNSFRVTIGCGGAAGGFGIPTPGIRVGGSIDLRVNWTAIGW